MENNMNPNNGNQQPVGMEDGTWVPVDASSLPFTVTGDASHPTIGPDGALYCLGNSAPSYGQIQSNQCNAIPTPSNIIQLPPIVQPIALVPYASQNQPLLQYDSHYRPAEPMSTSEPMYCQKPYPGMCVILILLAIASIAVTALLTCFSLTVDENRVTMSGLATILGIFQIFAPGIESKYYAHVLADKFADGFGAGFSGNAGQAVAMIAVPALLVVTIIFALVLMIKYVVKLGKRDNPHNFSIIALLGLIFSIAEIIVGFLSESIMGVKLTCGIGLYLLAAVFALILILPLFIKKDAVIIDYQASKRVYMGSDGMVG